MSKYVRYYNSHQIFYKNLAERWLKWAETAELTTSEIEGIKKFFYTIAKRFGLIREFRELGII